MSNMRSLISLIEKELLQEAKHSGICYHGTTSKFVSLILKNGFKADPEKKTYGTTGPLASYSGTYFTDTFEVALHRAEAAVNVFKGQACIFICEVDHDVYGDEDGIKEFMENLYHILEDEDFDVERYLDEDTQYHQEINKIVISHFYQEFDSYPTRDFYDLFLDLISGESLSDENSRAKMDKVAKQVGLSRAPGNYEAYNFRVNEDLDKVNILAVIQCKYDKNYIDPTTTGHDFSYKVIYGTIPPEIKQDLDYKVR